MVGGLSRFAMDPSFILKKIISVHITPIGLSLELMALGFLLILFSSRREKKSKKAFAGKRTRRIGKFLLFLGPLLLYLASIKPVSNALVYRLERQNPPQEIKNSKPVLDFKPECIVVLAGGAFHSLGSSPISSLSGPTLGRVSEAAVLWRQFPEAAFIVTGSRVETENMAAVARLMGVTPSKIIMEQDSRDTKDHPLKLKPVIAGRSFLLVTSATHMPRSLALFRKQGYHPVPAPAFFRASKPGSSQLDRAFIIDSLVPRSINLLNTRSAMHEFYGFIWAKFRHQIN